ncbi:hypothetical protein J4573_16645 [Actinomadura barringtoniae]|uniref:Uncharacterized protein n=1 Tax=Actinomadura barringtoniae TaxID=1427535 RepID=A0A939T3X4_9ACTN|nr:hypothetical protein [Actinomadura barringtoniae]MBO2448733.1 hypothetical protein [Actinomadura barringtoniae]
MKTLWTIPDKLRFGHRELVGRSHHYLANVRQEIEMWSDLDVVLSDVAPGGLYVLVARDWQRSSVALLGYRESSAATGEFYGQHQVRVCPVSQPHVAAQYVIEQVAVQAAKGAPGHCSGGGGPAVRGTLLPLSGRDTFPLPAKTPRIMSRPGAGWLAKLRAARRRHTMTRPER